MECTKIMLQAREFSAGAKIRVCILKKKKWSVKNEEHQEQDIDVFCGSKLTSVLAKILKCIFESQQPARSGSCPHFSCREADPGKNTSSHKLISALRRELFISPTGCIQKEKRRLATVRGGCPIGGNRWTAPVIALLRLSAVRQEFITIFFIGLLATFPFQIIVDNVPRPFQLNQIGHLVEVKSWDIILPKN